MTTDTQATDPELDAIIAKAQAEIDQCFAGIKTIKAGVSAQAAVAAALSAAASELDGELSEESTALLGAWAVEWAKQATSVQDHIRALITQPQHDALAAHVAAEVAKARAEIYAQIEAMPRREELMGGQRTEYIQLHEALAWIGAKP